MANKNVTQQDFLQVDGLPQTLPDFIGQSAITPDGEVYIAVKRTGIPDADWQRFELAPHTLSAHYDVRFDNAELFPNAVMVYDGTNWIAASTRQRVVNPLVNPVLTDSITGKKYELYATDSYGTMGLRESSKSALPHIITYDDAEMYVKVTVRSASVRLERVQNPTENPYTLLLGPNGLSTYTYRLTFSASLATYPIKTVLNEVENIHLTQKSIIDVTGKVTTAFPNGEFFGQLAIDTVGDSNPAAAVKTPVTWFWAGATKKWILGNNQQILNSDAVMTTELW